MRYVLRVNGAKDVYDDREFVTLIKNLVGKEAVVIVEHVEAIPQLRSGKFQAVVCNYDPGADRKVPMDMTIER